MAKVPWLSDRGFLYPKVIYTENPGLDSLTKKSFVDTLMITPAKLWLMRLNNLITEMEEVWSHHLFYACL